MNIIQPKPLIFDSSTWIALYNLSKRDNNQYLQKILKKINQNSIIPLLTWYNVSEIVNIESIDEAANRLNFFRHFNLIYLLNYTKTLPGSILDLKYYEYEFTACEPEIPFNELSEKVHSKLFLANGINISQFLNNDLYSLWEFSKNDALNSKVIASFIPPLLTPLYNRKLKDLENQYLKKYFSSEEISEQINQIQGILDTKGDTSLKNNTQQLAKTFVDGATYIREMLKANKSASKVLAEIFQVDEASLDKNFTLYDAIEHFTTYRESIKLISEKTKINIQKIYELDENRIPTWLVEKSLKIALNEKIAKGKNERTEGGNLNDKHLAAFSPYFDIIVDKRTQDLLNRIKKDEIFFKLKSHKLQSISELENLIDKLRNVE